MKSSQALVDVNTSEESARWDGYLKAVGAGVPPMDAMQTHNMLWREIELAVLSSPTEALRWRSARLMGVASRFSLLERDALFDRLSAGVDVERALIEVKGSETAERDLADFFQLVEALPDWSERHAAAMRAKGLRDMQQLETIADDMSRDTLDTLKGPIPNMAAVSRDKLRVETRQWRLAKMDPDRFSDKRANVAVQVNVAYAETLEAARTRATNRGKGMAPAKMREAIDAVFSEKPAPARAEQAVFTPEPAIEPARVADAMRQAAALEAETQEQTADQLRDKAAVEAEKSAPTEDAFGLDD